jgi:hypothetical protein
LPDQIFQIWELSDRGSILHHLSTARLPTVAPTAVRPSSVYLAGVGDGISVPAFAKKKKKKEAPAAYLSTQKKQTPVSDIAMCR